jgi:glycosyltransferase involved in cell wall biosynthesis
MKIAIDITYSPSGGSLTQIERMVEKFNQIDELEIIIYSKKNNNKLISDLTKNNKVVYSKLSNLSIIGRIIWGQVFLPTYLIREKVDILFCPGNFGPLFCSVKTIIWIGTIGPFFEDFIKNFLWLSKGQNRIKLYINKLFMILSSKRADAVIFESHFTKELFINRYNINQNKSYVINIGFDEYFADNKKMLSNFFGSNPKNSTEYILCVSHLYPYKNIISLIIAYKKILDNTKTSAKLIIAGGGGFAHYDEKIKKCINNLKLNDDVFLLGNVSKKRLKELYLNALLLAFPSPFENFAYTLVEAMTCGVPIVCSNTTAIPETCQKAAVYFDPYNSQDIADKIKIVLNNDLLRKEMSKKSIMRAKELPDYNEVTLKTLNIMKELINE